MISDLKLWLLQWLSKRPVLGSDRRSHCYLKIDSVISGVTLLFLVFSYTHTIFSGWCYYPSVRTENKGLLALFSVRQGRWIDYNFKSEITGTGSLSAIRV